MCVFAKGSSDEAFLPEPGVSSRQFLKVIVHSPDEIGTNLLATALIEPGTTKRFSSRHAQFHLAMRLRGIRLLLIAAW